MPNEENNDKIDWESGWYSKPNIEYVIDPDDEDRGILESIKEFFRLLF